MFGRCYIWVESDTGCLGGVISGYTEPVDVWEVLYLGRD
jgi:hypothetical protein